MIDPGVVKSKSYNAKIGMLNKLIYKKKDIIFIKIVTLHLIIIWHAGLDSLQVQPISKAAAMQRSGRAGREVLYYLFVLIQLSLFFFFFFFSPIFLYF